MLYQINQGTKYFGANLIFKDIQFEVKNNEKIALVGRNGSGKTTLLKIINKLEELDQGSIHQASNLEIGYLAQTIFENLNHTVIDELLTVFQPLLAMSEKLEALALKMSTDHSEAIMDQYAKLQDQFEHLNGYNYQVELKTVFSKFGFSEEELYKPLNEFSGGQKTKIAFVKLLLSKPDILLLDEPTNHLDLKTIEWLEGYLKTYPKAIILVSHDRIFLDQISEVVYELEFNTMTKYVGNYTNYVNMKKLNAEKQLIAYNNQQKDIERLELLIAKFRYKKNKAAFAQSKIKYLDRMEKIEVKKADEKTFHAHFQPRIKGGKRVLTLDELAIGYDEKLCTVSFDLMAKERLAIIGPNGKGKSTLIKTIVGKIASLGGNMNFGHQIEIGYFGQELAQINSDKIVLDEIWDDYPQLDLTNIRSVLGNFMFSADDVFKKVAVLSGGERVRLTLAKLMLKRANLLILDEPTNHLDILGKEALEEALIDYEGTLIFVAHDRYFIKKLATAVLEINDDKTNYYPLNYDEYMSKSTSINEQVVKPNLKEVKGKTKVEKVSLVKLEKQIAEAESELEALRAKRFDPEYYHDYQKMQELDELIDVAHTKIDQLINKWELAMAEKS